VQELADGVWRWTARHPEWHPAGFGDEVACFAALGDDALVLIDPLLPDDDDAVLTSLDALAGGRVRILVTIPYHVRSSEQLWRRWAGERDVTIHGHASVAGRLDDAAGFRPLEPGELPGGEVRVHPIGSPRRAEMPVELTRHAALAFGDAVVEADGRLRVWDDPLDSDRRRRWWEERFLPTLRPLADLPIERVLVTHGTPILRDGAAALAAALSEPPWQRGQAGVPGAAGVPGPA
jgi:hypothetical protein